jgi:hypothetical protein
MNRGKPNKLRGGGVASINEINDKLIKEFERILDTNGVTTGEQLDRVAKLYFPKEYKGLYIEGEKLPKLRNDTFIILNHPLNEHWIMVFRKFGRNYEYDTYGRDVLGNGYIDLNTPNDRLDEQLHTESHCGQRVLAMAWILFKL